MIHDQSAIDEGGIPLEHVQILLLSASCGRVERDIIVATTPNAQWEEVELLIFVGRIVDVVVIQSGGLPGFECVRKRAGPHTSPGDIQR